MGDLEVQGMAKVVFTSDLHMDWPNVPPCDLLVIAGDFTYRGTPQELVRFRNAVEAWRGRGVKEVVGIPGNHDIGVQTHERLARDILDNMVLLIDQPHTTACGLKVWGLPWTPSFGPWAFMAARGDEISRHYRAIPEGLDILISHGPPAHILDTTREGLEVGCWDLAELVRRIRPRYHVFGHIHEGYGRHEDPELGVTYLNVSHMDRRYDPVNPIVIEEIEPRA